MFFDMLTGANQALNQGQMTLQQAMLTEAGGDLQSTAQLYDQAIQQIVYSMQLAWQAGQFVPPHVYFSLSWAQFHGGRVRVAVGWGQFAQGYFAYALQSINSAIGFNPQVPQFHSLAGSILLMQGNVPTAEVAFSRAVQLNPADTYSAGMLTFIKQQRGGAFQTPSVPGMPPLPQGGNQSMESMRLMVSQIVKDTLQNTDGTSLWKEPVHAGSYSTDKPTSALEIWQQKLNFLQEEEAVAADSARKFELRHNINEAKQKIQELSGQTPSRGGRFD